MDNPVDIGEAKPVKAKKAKQPTRRAAPPEKPCVCGQPMSLGVVHRKDKPCYIPDEDQHDVYEAPVDDRAANAEPVSHGVPVDLSGEPVAPTMPVNNPYAPTGWRKKVRVEFDLQTPSGQTCRIMRLERDDLLRLNLLESLDTFTPMLMDEALSNEERQEQLQQAVQDNPDSMPKMFEMVDKVVMATTINPRVTADRKQTNYGTETDWKRPDFVATVHLDDIDLFDRMYIFGAAFGQSMDDLKSLFGEAEGMAGLAN